MSKSTKTGGLWSFLKGLPNPTACKTPPKKPVAPVEKTYKVTGMQYRLDNLLALAVENKDYRLDKRGLIKTGLIGKSVYEYNFNPKKAELVPEPDNPHDPKAIKVIVEGRHIGYIKAGSCAHLLKVIQEGRIWRIRCTIGGGKYKEVYEDYGEDDEKVAYTFEKGETSYFVHLKILERP